MIYIIIIFIFILQFLIQDMYVIFNVRQICGIRDIYGIYMKEKKYRIAQSIYLNLVKKIR